MFDNAPPSAGEVRAFANQLLAWADRLTSAHRPCHLLADADRHEFVLAQAEAARDCVRLRASIFADSDVISPAWRILLEIFVREAGGHRVPLDQLAEWSGLPPLTVLRSVNGLIEKGLVERGNLDSESRAVPVAMSLTGWRKMTDFMLQCSVHAEIDETGALVRKTAGAAG